MLKLVQRYCSNAAGLWQRRTMLSARVLGLPGPEIEGIFGHPYSPFASVHPLLLPLLITFGFISQRNSFLLLLQGTHNQLPRYFCCVGRFGGLCKTRCEVEKHYRRGWHLCAKWQEEKGCHQIRHATICYSNILLPLALHGRKQQHYFTFFVTNPHADSFAK